MSWRAITSQQLKYVLCNNMFLFAFTFILQDQQKGFFKKTKKKAFKQTDNIVK